MLKGDNQSQWKTQDFGLLRSLTPVQSTWNLAWMTTSAVWHYMLKIVKIDSAGTTSAKFGRVRRPNHYITKPQANTAG